MAVIGVGLIGAFHAENLSGRIPGARLVGLADPLPGVAEQHAARLGCQRWSRDYQELLTDAAVEAVVIATPSHHHADVIVAAAQAGKAVFCEKPIARTLADADRAIHATHAAGVPFQIGFQRRFDSAYRRARDLVCAGDLGRLHMLRSLTRDPALNEPERVPAFGIFSETLVHDFDALRFLSGGAEPLEIYAMADAQVQPDWKDRGLLDTAVATIRFDTGAFGIVDASFQAVYGYDVRAEIFGTGGMLRVGDQSPVNLVQHDARGSTQPRLRWFMELFRDAYESELAAFVKCARSGAQPDCTGEDGRAALLMALTAIRSVETGQPVRVQEIA